MQVPPDLRPTLWRTCRVLANYTRLRIFGFLLDEPGQTVSSVAENCDLSISVASQYLRLLESRGLLRARRLGRSVKYEVALTDQTNSSADLVRALQIVFALNPKPVRTVFRLVTAFTHPRRLAIFRALSARPLTFDELRGTTKISIRSLDRHLAKLARRGFTTHRDGVYMVTQPSGVLQRVLVRLTKR